MDKQVKLKVIRLYALIALFASAVAILAIKILVSGSLENMFGMILADVLIFFAFVLSFKKLKEMLEQLKYTTNLTKSYQTADYVQERQDRD